MKTQTRGDVVIEDIKIGDVHHEYDVLSDTYIKVTVITPPFKPKGGSYWEWQAKSEQGVKIKYFASEKSLEARYNPVLYKTTDQ